MQILEPLASFLGTDRMTKRGCLTAVLAHVYGGSSDNGASLIDKDDNDYVLADAKLQPLLHELRKKYRVKLRKLARYVCKFMVPEDQEKKRIHPVSETPASYDDHVCNLPVKVLWSFKNTVAFDNAVFILTETKIVETEVLQLLDSNVKETVSMFLDQTQR